MTNYNPTRITSPSSGLIRVGRNWKRLRGASPPVAGFLYSRYLYINKPAKEHTVSVTKTIAVIAGVVILVAVGVGAGLYFGKNKSPESTVIKANTVVDESGNKRPAKTKPSPDKYTWFIKDYVGRNASDSCSYRLNDECMEDYGDSTLTIKFVTADGSKVSKDNVSNYIVTDQSVDPDTQLTLVYEEGYDYVKSQNIEEIVLNMKPINAN